MSIPMARVRVLLHGLLCLLVLLASEGARRGLRAQEGRASDLSLFLSFKKDGVKPARAVELRPNVLQEVFVYVQNSGNETQTVTVQLVAADGKSESSLEVTAEKNKTTLVRFPPPAPVAPGSKAAPMESLAMPLVVRMTDKGGAIGRSLPIVIASPADYLKVKSAQFYPDTTKQGQSSNRLEVIVERNKEFPFGGPASRVELDLRPDRVRSLVPGQEKKGRYAGLLAADTPEVVLEAKDLQFDGNDPGYVYLNVDGLPRAFVFGANFPATGRPTTSLAITKPILATSLPRYVRPTGPTPLVIETGGLISETARIKLDLLASSKDGKDVYAEVAEFKGPRQEKILFGKTGPSGGLLFQPEVKDWTATVDLTGVHGPTKVRLRLLDQDGKELEVVDGTTVTADTETAAKEVVQLVTIDSTPPVVEGFAGVSPKAVRGRKLALRARCADDESKVSDVVFYVGKPGPDGKMAAGAPEAKGRPGKDKDVWLAEFDVAADQKGPLDLLVRATNGVGMQASKGLALEVVDIDPDYGTVLGKVFEKGTPVDHVRVRLYDAKGVLRRRDRSAEGGKFTFKDLLDGTYQMKARRETTNYAGEKEVTVKDKKVYVGGKEQTDPIELVLQAPLGGGRARISGVVREGDYTQTGVALQLSDATSNKALFTTKTGTGGRYEFKDLPPGKYKVSATRSASRTKAERTVDLKEGEDKTGVDLKLYR